MEAAREAILSASATKPANAVGVRGPCFADCNGVSEAVAEVCATYSQTGYQATHLGRAIDILRTARRARLPGVDADEYCTMYLGVVGNLFATGVRGALRFMAASQAMDHVVVSGGGPEHDLRRLFPYHDYRHVADASKPPEPGFVRLANVEYRKGPSPDGAAATATEGGIRTCCWESFMHSALDELRRTRAHARSVEADEVPRGDAERPPVDTTDALCIYAPSRLWHALAQIADRVLPPEVTDTSFLIACARRGINVFTPSITDGDLEDLLVDRADADQWIFDLTADLDTLNRSALKAKKSAMMIIGGGIVKHHVCNANLMRNGADLAVFVNTAQEFDGSDGGARPDEAVSWGKLKTTAKHVKVYSEASLVVPILVQQAYAEALPAVAATTNSNEEEEVQPVPPSS